jgi:xanthine/uracil permease
MRASLITATVLICGATALTQPAFAAVGLDASISPSTNLITVVKAKKQSKKSTKSMAPDTSGGTAATGSNATPGGK